MNDATRRSLVHPRRLLTELAETCLAKEDWRIPKVSEGLIGRSVRHQLLWERVTVSSPPIGIEQAPMGQLDWSHPRQRVRDLVESNLVFAVLICFAERDVVGGCPVPEWEDLLG